MRRVFHTIKGFHMFRHFKLATTLSTAALISALPVQADHHAETMTVTGSDGAELIATPLETFDNPWAMTFLTDGRALVTQKTGEIYLLGTDGKKMGEIENGPEVSARGQGGLGDIIIHPDFDENGLVFISYVERDAEDDSLSGAVVERAQLTLTSEGGVLSNRKMIWAQSQKLTGNGHYSYRLAIAPDGNLIITSGERQHFTPSQNMDVNMGKIIRVTIDGEALEDNPFYGQGGVTDTIWSLGHRNMLGLDFDADGQLWVHEMGPKGGDELNRIVRGENYGYPIVSDGEHYDGKQFFGSHDEYPIYENPALSWTPVISPSGFIIYYGDKFADWQGDGFIGGLSSKALIRVEFEESPLDNMGAGESKTRTETTAKEAARYS